MHIYVIKTSRLTAAVDVGAGFEQTLNFSCSECTLNDVRCRGESALPWGGLAIIPQTKMLNFNFPRFEDQFSCVYVGVFERNKRTYSKILAVIESHLVNGGCGCYQCRAGQEA
ncbi:jg7665 [Pararge aegeria aegeria]|uniref:Jg7665 protein n=1 Tax=Pararge aegeria aegeria TaxID=348720 RepID=A0A8S4QSZ0_9NEOP|nr:jg7665 [Pararge aegeria aegeria]